MRNSVIASLIAYLCCFLFSCDFSGDQMEERIPTDSLETKAQDPNPAPLLDTLTQVSSIIGYEIALTNYFKDSLIDQSMLDMKNFITLSYRLDSILPEILIHKHAVDIGLSQSNEEVKVLKHEFSSIRAHHVYFDVEFMFKDQRYEIAYGLVYKGKRKEKYGIIRG